MANKLTSMIGLVMEDSPALRRFAGALLCAGVLGAGMTANTEFQQFRENRATMQEHRQEVDTAQTAFNDSALDFVDHMTQDEFNNFAYARARVGNISVDAFVASRDEEWMDRVLDTDQVIVRREIGRSGLQQSGNTFLDGGSLRGDGRTNARNQVRNMLGNIVNNATIGEPEFDTVEEMAGHRAIQLAEIRANPPEIEQRVRFGRFTAGITGVGASVAGLFKLKAFSNDAVAKKEEERRQEQEELDSLFQDTVTAPDRKIAELEERYSGRN